MSMKCEICGVTTEIEPIMCCDGSECACMGLPVNEESALCDDCRELVERLEKHGAVVFNKDGSQIYIEE